MITSSTSRLMAFQSNRAAGAANPMAAGASAIAPALPTTATAIPSTPVAVPAPVAAPAPAATTVSTTDTIAWSVNLPVPAVAPAPVAAPAPTVPPTMPGLVASVSQGLQAVQQQAQALIDQLTAAPAQATPPEPKPEPKPAPKPQPKPAAATKPVLGSPWKPGPGRLQGADTSHYQSDATFQKTLQNSEFSLIKATQGTTYVDPTFASRWAQMGKMVDKGEMTLRMAYVFLNPGNGEAQAKHFLQTVGVDGPLPAGTRLVIDWEAAALNSPSTLRDCANYIHKVTGTWPLIYVQGSRESTAKQYVPEAPIWRAAWSSHIGSDVPFVQYSDGPVYDHDVFNGDKEALRRFAGYA